jgi:hypothetical protein
MCFVRMRSHATCLMTHNSTSQGTPQPNEGRGEQRRTQREGEGGEANERHLNQSMLMEHAAHVYPAVCAHCIAPTERARFSVRNNLHLFAWHVRYVLLTIQSDVLTRFYKTRQASNLELEGILLHPQLHRRSVDTHTHTHKHTHSSLYVVCAMERSEW